MKPKKLRPRFKLWLVLLLVAVATPLLWFRAQPIAQARFRLWLGQPQQAWQILLDAEDSEARDQLMRTVLDTPLDQVSTFWDEHVFREVNILCDGYGGDQRIPWCLRFGPAGLAMNERMRELKRLLDQPPSRVRDEGLSAILRIQLVIADDRTEQLHWYWPFRWNFREPDPREPAWLRFGPEGYLVEDARARWERSLAGTGGEPLPDLLRYLLRTEVELDKDIGMLIIGGLQRETIGSGRRSLYYTLDDGQFPDRSKADPWLRKVMAAALDEPEGANRDEVIHAILFVLTRPGSLAPETWKDPRLPAWATYGRRGREALALVASLRSWPLAACFPPDVAAVWDSPWGQSRVPHMHAAPRRALEGLRGGTRATDLWKSIITEFDASSATPLATDPPLRDLAAATVVQGITDLVSRSGPGDACRRVELLRLGHVPAATGELRCMLCGEVTGPAVGVTERADGQLSWSPAVGPPRLVPLIDWPKNWSRRDGQLEVWPRPTMARVEPPDDSWSAAGAESARLASLAAELPAWPWYACVSLADPGVADELLRHAGPGAGRLPREADKDGELRHVFATLDKLLRAQGELRPRLRDSAFAPWVRNAAYELCRDPASQARRDALLVWRLGHIPVVQEDGAIHCAYCGEVTGPAPGVSEAEDGTLIWSPVPETELRAPPVGWMPASWTKPTRREAMAHAWRRKNAERGW